jgi:hypothetical protein
MGMKIPEKKHSTSSREEPNPIEIVKPPAESRIPLLIFMVFIITTLAINSMVLEDPRDRVQAIQRWPVVEVSTQDLIDECGVFMWVKWVGPDFGHEEPFIPMRDRYR